MAETDYDVAVKTLTVKLPDLLFAEITDAAKARKVTTSAIVRERLELATKQESTLWSRMADLVIEDDALPTDLSSNKKHLQSYGNGWIQPFPVDLLERARSVVEGVEVDLNGPLVGED